MNTYKYVGQAAYGTDTYGNQTYACGQNQVCTTSAGAPNTGFFGSSDAVYATIGGALLIAIGITGAVMVIVSRLKRRRAQAKEQ